MPDITPTTKQGKKIFITIVLTSIFYFLIGWVFQINFKVHKLHNPVDTNYGFCFIRPSLSTSRWYECIRYSVALNELYYDH